MLPKQFRIFFDKMGCVKYLSFLLVLALANLVQSKTMCNLDDDECLTKGVRKFYKTLVAGKDGFVEPLEPIRVGKIEGESPGLKYSISNGTMTGLKDCEVTKLKLKKQDLSYEYNLLCPQLFVYFHYAVKGFFGTIPVDGIAEEKVTIDDYYIQFKGNYAIYVSEKDKKRRGVIKNFVIETEPRGKLTFETTNLIRGDRKKVNNSNAFANQNWKEIEKIMKSPLIETFMKSIIDKANMHFKDIPLEDILSQE